MFQTMTQIAKNYELDAKDVGNILYELKIRDAKHPDQKGFPFDQAITHGIAQATTARSGERYYRYNIHTIKEEFEKKVTALKSKQPQRPKQEATQAEHVDSKTYQQRSALDQKLQSMLKLLNEVLASGELEKLYRLKADIADIYALEHKIPT